MTAGHYPSIAAPARGVTFHGLGTGQASSPPPVPHERPSLLSIVNAPRGHGLFEFLRANGDREVTSIRRLAGTEPTPGSALIAPAAWLPAALGDAAEYKRDRAETCADCAGQSCTTCQWRLHVADAHDQLASQMSHTAEASAARPHAPGPAAPGTGEPHAAADKEAGQ